MRPRDHLLDDFLVESAPEAEALDTLTLIPGRLAPVTPARSLLSRLLNEATPVDRFARFAAGVSALLDVPEEVARAICNRVDQPEGWVRDPTGAAELLWVEGGPRVCDAITGFVRVEAGGRFPEHTHLGEEQVLVMQGAFIDTVDGTVARPGDVITRGAGTEHAFHVPEEGMDVLLLAVVKVGVEMAGHRFDRDNPIA